MSTSPSRSPTRKPQSPKKQESNGGFSPINEASDRYSGLTHRDVEVEHLKTQIIAIHEEYKVVEDIWKDVKNLRDREENHRIGGDDLRNYIDRPLAKSVQEEDDKNAKYESMLDSENQELQRELEALMAEIQSVNTQSQQQTAIYQRQLNQKDEIIQQFRENNQGVERNNNEMKGKLKLEQLEQELKEIKANNAYTEKEKQKLQEDLRIASQYIEDLDNKTYRANKTSLELLKQLKESEAEVETLKNYIIDLKQRIAVYIPVKGDPIDARLAEYINNYPDRSKLKIMFMRESEGVYSFGTKRIYVRVEKDKINIRVGGGYLSIDEFIDQYTPTELEKLERKDPLKKFSERVAIQKALVGKELRETSPIRGGESPLQSPSRQSRGSPRRQNSGKSPKKAN